jgi:hypothetical protein
MHLAAHRATVHVEGLLSLERRRWRDRMCLLSDVFGILCFRVEFEHGLHSKKTRAPEVPAVCINHERNGEQRH